MKTNKRIILRLMLALVALFMGTKAMALEAYAVLSDNDKTLTFYYDNNKASYGSKAYALNTGENKPGWYKDFSNYDENPNCVEKVVFTNDFRNARPTSTWYWFCDQEKLTSIKGLGNMNTSDVTTMYAMFYACMSLKDLDLSSFDTRKVTNMAWMFSCCVDLESLDVSSFDTSNVTNMKSMFDCCYVLPSLDVSGFDTSNVTDMSWMFNGCEVLTSLDVSGFNTSAVTNMSGMFCGCQVLESLDVSGFDTSKVTNIGWMFNMCTNLKSIDVSGFNTSAVKYMDRMFASCYYLTSLDLSCFNTASVIAMSNMFTNCDQLTTIYVGSGFVTEQVEESVDMFDGCAALKGEQGTTINTSYLDKTYAHIDGGSSNPGYFSLRKYDLKVCGVQVTGMNKNDILGDGTVSFDPAKNTLMLHNASFSIDAPSGFGVYNQIPDLEVFVGGDNTIESKQWTAFSAIQNTHFKGRGTLRLKGYSWGLSCGSSATKISVSNGIHLICQGGENATAESPGIGGGFSGTYSGRRPPYTYNNTLEVSGEGTVLEVKGAGYASSLYDLADLVLGSGLAITAPAGASFNVSKHAICYADGNIIKGDWVIIDGQTGITTNISEPVTQPTADQPMYNLSGQRVGKDYKGIVIHNGTKVVIK